MDQKCLKIQGAKGHLKKQHAKRTPTLKSSWGDTAPDVLLTRIKGYFVYAAI